MKILKKSLSAFLAVVLMVCMIPSGSVFAAKKLAVLKINGVLNSDVEGTVQTAYSEFGCKDEFWSAAQQVASINMNARIERSFLKANNVVYTKVNETQNNWLY